MHNNKYVLAILYLLGGDENAIEQCYDITRKLVNGCNENALKQKFQLLEWHKKKLKKKQGSISLNNLKNELIKFLNSLLETQLEEDFSSILKDVLSPLEYELKIEIEIPNKYADLRELMSDFCNQWKGKNPLFGHTSGQNYMFLQEKDHEVVLSEVYFEIDIIHAKLLFLGTGDLKMTNQFITRIKDWWIQEIKNKSILKVFISYSHYDEIWKNALITNLAILKHDKKITIWHDRAIQAGTEWSKEIEEAMNSSQIILLLTSPDYISSEYCYLVETPKAIERHKEEKARVIPVFVRDAIDKGAPYLSLQGFPRDKLSLKSFGRASSDNKGILQVAGAITEIVEQIHSTGKIV